MKGDGAGGDVEDVGGFFHRFALGEELQDFALAHGEGFLVGVAFGARDEEADGFAGDRKGDVNAAHGDGVDGFEEFGGGAFFEHVTVGAAADGFFGGFGIFIDGEENDFGVGQFLDEEFAGFEAVEVGHVDVGNNDVGAEFFGGGDEGASIRGGANDFAGGFDQFFEGFEQNDVIVGEEDANSIHTAMLFAICRMMDGLVDS